MRDGGFAMAWAAICAPLVATGMWGWKGLAGAAGAELAVYLVMLIALRRKGARA